MNIRTFQIVAVILLVGAPLRASYTLESSIPAVRDIMSDFFELPKDEKILERHLKVAEEEDATSDSIRIKWKNYIYDIWAITLQEEKEPRILTVKRTSIDTGESLVVVDINFDGRVDAAKYTNEQKLPELLSKPQGGTGDQSEKKWQLWQSKYREILKALNDFKLAVQKAKR